ncbi:MAG: hypothetical protein PHQ47_00990 [Candidatus Portnoybacteria bacterium]|nr:hypothetical protein [Candidatus Portnoybacteria bacterium]
MQKEILTIILSFLCLVAVFFFLLMPAWNSITEAREEFALKSQDLAENKEIIKKMEELNVIYESNLDEFEKLESIVPHGPDLPSLLLQVENLAISNNLFLGSISISEVQEQKLISPPMMEEDDSLLGGAVSEEAVESRKNTSKNDYKLLQLSLRLSGSYEAIKQYLRALENNIRLMDVASLELSGGDGKETTAGEFGLNVSINVYYQ